MAIHPCNTLAESTVFGGEDRVDYAALHFPRPYIAWLIIALRVWVFGTEAQASHVLV
jgi:hypothetical protein